MLKLVAIGKKGIKIGHLLNVFMVCSTSGNGCSRDNGLDEHIVVTRLVTMASRFNDG